MIQPVRIQLSRKKGFNLQEYSKSINGLPCKIISRPSKYGNPIILKGDCIYIDVKYRRPALYLGAFYDTGNIVDVLYLYKRIIKGSRFKNADLQYWSDKFKQYDIKELKGFNLACWCKTTDWCHGDVLLDLLKNIDNDL